MRRPLAIAVLVAAAVLLVSAALDRREVAFEANLPAFDLVANLAPGAEVCADGIDVPAAFDRVRLVVGQPRREAQPLTVVLTDEATGSRVGRASFAGGPSNAGGDIEVAVGHVPAGGRLRGCVTNDGESEQSLFGSPPDRSATEPPVVAFGCVRDPAPTLLSLVPELIGRSALFKPGFYGTWTSWLLLGVVLLAVPFALSRALSAAYASDRS
jgi:hypothetical protein